MLDRIRRLDWLAFENFIGEVFRRRGYEVELAGGPEADGGYDILLHRETETALVQCKHWLTWKVSVGRVRELVGAVSKVGASRGIFVTTGTFSEPAKRFAQDMPLELIDGTALVAIASGVDERSTVTSNESQACPKCGKPMRWRVARKGANAGKGFWGCSAFPHCWGRREAA